MVLLIRKERATIPAPAAGDAARSSRPKRLVLAIAALVGALLVGNGAYSVWSARQEALADAERATSNLARVLDAHLGSALTAAEAKVNALATIAASGGAASGELVDRVLADAPSTGPLSSAVTVLDSDGTIRHSSDPALLGWNFADRPYFRKHRDGHRGPAISEVLTNRLTGNPAVIITRRIDDAHGRFLGVACDVLDLQYVESVFRSINIGATGSVTLVRSDGELVARWPPLARLPPNIASGPLLSQHLAQSAAGTYTGVGFDGAPRIFSYRKIGDSPLVIVVGLSTPEVLSGWRSRAVTAALATAGFLVLAAWLMLMVLRALARHEDDERVLRARHAQLMSAQELARLGSWVIEMPPGGSLGEARAQWSEEMARTFGYGPGETRLPLDEALDHVHPDDRQRAAESLQNALEHGSSPGGEYRMIGADGQVHDVAIRGAAIKAPDGRVTMTGFVQDITERKRTQNELERAKQQLIALSQRLFEVQEDERRSLSRELHDEVGQLLTLLVMELRTASVLDPPDRTRIVSCVDLARHALEQVRDISFALRPALLDELGLEPALRWMTNRLAGACHWHARLQCDPDMGRFEPAVELACFRIAQEAVTNVSKHACATWVDVSLRKAGEQLELVIADDGRGFEPAAAALPRGVGLISMRERAQLVGGSLAIDSAPGRGTRVTALLPTAPQARQHPAPDALTSTV